jgi:hypothetical protein
MMMVSQPQSTALYIENVGTLFMVLLIFWASLIVYAMYGVLLWRQGGRILSQALVLT